MAFAVILGIMLVLATTLFHYAVLRRLSSGLLGIALPAETRVLLVVLAMLCAHIAEIILYALAYATSSELIGIGAFGGLPVREPLDYFYFSIVTYTSLGLGDVFPGNHLRFITGIEALNGLLLIAWSGSFLYLTMGRMWPMEHCVERTQEKSTARPR